MIDMTFRVGDIVVVGSWDYNRYGIEPSRKLEIIQLTDKAAVCAYHNPPRGKAGERFTIPLKDLRFGCHNHGAPFEKMGYKDDAKRDGYYSGLAIGLAGQFYTASGPHVPKFDSQRDCRHFREHYEACEHNNKKFVAGWREGQARAKSKKRINFRKPLQAVGRDMCVPAQYLGVTPGDNKKRQVHVGGKTYSVDTFGSLGHGYGHYEFIVENVPMTMNTRRGYQIIGLVSLTFYQSLVEASEKFHTILDNPDAMIIEVEQEASEGGRWKTTTIVGPVDPLPKVERRTDVLRYRSDGVALALNYQGNKVSTDQIVEVDLENGKIVAVRHVQ